MDFSTIARSTTEGPQPLKTERYCAPEVAGGRERGRRSDVYSLGCLFVEVATVMLGFDLQALDDELGGDGVFHESAFQLSNWVSRLTRDAEEDDAAIVNWIPPMIHKHPGSRPQMQKVVDDMLEDTRAYKELRGQLFCDLCTNEMREMKMISTLTTGVKALDLQEDSDYEFGKSRSSTEALCLTQNRP
jgi:serine/threonine protein kinase